MSIFSEIDKLSANAGKYEAFYKKLIVENEKFNLTSITDEREAAFKHFIDSVYCKDVFAVDKTVAEVGSGAGFPSVPLAIERPDLKFTLIESNNKKCNFLNETKNLLDLKNVKIVCERAEVAGKDKTLRESFDYAIARGVAKINVLLEYLMPFLKVGGSALLWKGEGYKEELEASKNALSVLGGRLKDVAAYDLAEYGKRYLVAIEKTRITPEKYPRGNGKERKCPL